MFLTQARANKRFNHKASFMTYILFLFLKKLASYQQMRKRGRVSGSPLARVPVSPPHPQVPQPPHLLALADSFLSSLHQRTRGCCLLCPRVTTNRAMNGTMAATTTPSKDTSSPDAQSTRGRPTHRSKRHRADGSDVVSSSFSGWRESLIQNCKA